MLHSLHILIHAPHSPHPRPPHNLILNSQDPRVATVGTVPRDKQDLRGETDKTVEMEIPEPRAEMELRVPEETTVEMDPRVCTASMVYSVYGVYATYGV